ncbi:MAG: DUF2934 domain-containing protein [Acidobacteriota bacterium]|mgnify:CR=1 FL=1
MATRTTKKPKEAAGVPVPAPTEPLSAPLSAAELHTRITTRAYEIFLARNGAPGDETSDWLTAEYEVCHSLLAPPPTAETSVPLTAAPKRKRSTPAKTTVSRSAPKSTKSLSGTPTQKTASAPRIRKRKETN